MAKDASEISAFPVSDSEAGNVFFTVPRPRTVDHQQFKPSLMQIISEYSC